MLTDLIREDDPMRHKIRQTTLSILSDTRGLSYALSGDLYFHLARVISRSWEVMSLIEVCVVVGFISDMNYAILKNALIDFISDLRNKQKIEGFSHIQDLQIGVGESHNFKLKSDFFKLDQKDLSSIKGESGFDGSFDKSPVKKSLPSPIENRKSPSPAIKPIKASNPEHKPAVEPGDRADKILHLIHEKRDISIKDIVSYFSEYSQKTIQRDLAQLVQSGKIKRSGEKRWSRYTI
jgi:hypothetical protein